jgi:hypothetical protein
MNSIKIFFLKWKVKQALKAQKVTKRQTPNYDEASTIGILLKTEQEAMVQATQLFIQKLLKDGKKVTVLVYIAKPEHTITFNFQHYTVTEKEIDHWGNFNSEIVETFVGQAFDYLYCISKEEEIIFQYILAKSKAKCRVGTYKKENAAFFELMINLQSEQDIDIFTEQALHYTQSIIYN